VTTASAEPTFLIIGAAKSGTTTLFNALGDHPDVFVSPIKETNYFTVDPERPPGPVDPVFPVRTLEAYRSLFAAGAALPARGEASPLYMERPAVARRVAQALPRARLIAILRNPVDRAWSAYRMSLRLRGRRLDPETAFDEDAAWLHPGSPFVRGGYYAAALRPWRELFPRQQLRIALFDDLLDDPHRLLRDLYGYLGVDPAFRGPDPAHYNPGGEPRSRVFQGLLHASRIGPILRRRFPTLRGALRRLQGAALTPPPPLPPRIRARLAALYADDVHEVESLLGRDLSAWTREGSESAR